MQDKFTYGIEEEFFLVDPHSLRLASSLPRQFLLDCGRQFGERAGPEMQQAQVEIATPILHDAHDARVSLAELRGGVGRIAAAHGMRLMSAGTHPMAGWIEQRHTDELRYDTLIDEYQMVGRRNLLSALHVHVAVPDRVDRVRLMNRLMPWLPMFLALSTSSPFWGGRNTGLLSYRQAAYDEWPRSGIPDAFDDEAEYASFIELLAKCDGPADGSYLWWAVRPSARYPTLELRISDACTRMKDALAIAAIFRCLVRAYVRMPELGLARSAVTRRVIEENRWRAKRHGTQAAFIDESSRGLVSFDETLAKLCALVAEDAWALGCEDELRHLCAIPLLGTSAHAQLDLYWELRRQGSTREAALREVAGWLCDETEVDVPRGRPPVLARGNQGEMGAANA
jgi:carboxylate-amine ligase